MLSDSTLATGLEAMTPTYSEALAAQRLSDAWETYFYDAETLAVPVTPGSLATAKTAFQTALSGMSVAGQGAQKIQDAITAFWGVVAGLASIIWVGTTGATPSPTLNGIAVALQAVFDSNQAGNKSLAEAANNIAVALHPIGGLGGIAQWPGGPEPIT